MTLTANEKWNKYTMRSVWGTWASSPRLMYQGHLKSIQLCEYNLQGRALNGRQMCENASYINKFVLIHCNYLKKKKEWLCCQGTNTHKDNIAWRTDLHVWGKWKPDLAYNFSCHPKLLHLGDSSCGNSRRILLGSPSPPQSALSPSLLCFEHCFVFSLLIFQ